MPKPDASNSCALCLGELVPEKNGILKLRYVIPGPSGQPGYNFCPLCRACRSQLYAAVSQVVIKRANINAVEIEGQDPSTR